MSEDKKVLTDEELESVNGGATAGIAKVIAEIKADEIVTARMDSVTTSTIDPIAIKTYHAEIPLIDDFDTVKNR